MLYYAHYWEFGGVIKSGNPICNDGFSAGVVTKYNITGKNIGRSFCQAQQPAPLFSVTVRKRQGPRLFCVVPPSRHCHIYWQFDKTLYIFLIIFAKTEKRSGFAYPNRNGALHSLSGNRVEPVIIYDQPVSRAAFGHHIIFTSIGVAKGVTH